MTSKSGFLLLVFIILTPFLIFCLLHSRTTVVGHFIGLGKEDEIYGNTLF